MRAAHDPESGTSRSALPDFLRSTTPAGPAVETDPLPAASVLLRLQRLPRVRVTVRRVMLIVAIVALLLGGARFWALRQLYLKQAHGHATYRAYLLQSPDVIQYWENRWTALREGLPARYPWPGGSPFVPAIAKYHDDMRIKYERAARYPWLSVEPDPLPLAP